MIQQKSNFVTFDADTLQKSTNILDKIIPDDEHLFSKMFDALPAAIYTTDADGQLTYFNPAAIDFSGREPELYTDEWCVTWKLYHPDGTPMPHDECPMAIALKEGRTIRGTEAIAERPDGERIWFKAYPSPLRDDEGNIIGGINMLIDITERRQSDKLQEEQAKLLELIASDASLDECFSSLCAAIPELNPGVRASVMLADDQGEVFQRPVAPDLLSSFGEGLEGALIKDRAIGTCGEAVYYDKPVKSVDIANDDKWSKEWRELCIAHDILACYSEPVPDKNGQPAGSLMLCFNEPREPTEWEQRLADFGARIASIALERDQSKKVLQERKDQLASRATSMERLHALSTQLLLQDDVEAALHEVMAASAELLHAGKASVQIYDEHDDVLRLVSSFGFDQEFADRFRIMETNGFTTCAAALGRRERVLVEDLSTDPDFSEFAQATEPYCVRAALSTPLYGGDGRLLGVFTVYWDNPHRPGEDELQLLDLYTQQAAQQIERKRAAEALRESEVRLRSIVETTPECIKVVAADGTLLQMNPAGLTMVEAESASAVVGGCVYDLIAPEHRKLFQAFNERICRGESGVFQFDIIGLQGTRRHMETHAVPLHNPDGTVAQLALTRDITENKRAQTALKESEKKYRTLLDSMPVAAFVCDTSGVLQYYNRRAVEIWGRKPTCGDPKEKYCGSFKLYLPDGTVLPHSQSPMVEVLREGEPKHNIEVDIEQPGGSRIPVIVNFSPLKNMKGEVEGVITSFEDISELKHNEKELQEMNETLEERVEERTASLLSYQEQLRSLASRLSKAEENERHRLATELHDNLGQMLAVGKMKLDLVQGEELPDRIAPDMAEIRELMDDALTYTRELMSDLKPPPSINEEDMSTALDWLANKMKKHALKVVVEDDEEPKPLDEEVRTTILQSVRELLFNVVKHSGVNEAFITLIRMDGEAQVVVKDEGKGFEPKNITQSLTEGGGFGLFNIRERVDLLGGRIDVVSEPGKGTEITITAPLSDGEKLDKSNKDEETGKKRSSSQSNHKVKVLLVDDHQMMREGLRKIVNEEEDLRVVAEASDGKEAIRLAREASPDIVVMDVNMPGMNGIDATQKIVSEMRDMRVIGLSLHSHEDVVESMQSAGASAYLTKNEAFETLCATIRSEAALAKK